MAKHVTEWVLSLALCVVVLSSAFSWVRPTSVVAVIALSALYLGLVLRPR